ncbi:MAG TPA: alpha-glucuronidase family glycosyl hydrolase [Thermoclostridium caenicola]|nr:alpha-glucuronidase family glycosyl hydrolase [Thermoclostridium caenicola]
MIKPGDAQKQGRAYNCWLAYRPLENAVADQYRTICKKVAVAGQSAIMESAVDELKRGLKGILGVEPEVLYAKSDTRALFIGSESGVELTADDMHALGDEGFILKTCKDAILIAGKTDRGVLYGTFAFLRCLQVGIKPEDLSRMENPAAGIRMINHWDNLDGSIERGYAGNSIFFRDNQFIADKSRVRDYARLLSSVGINGISINNVNVHARETRLITRELLPEVAELAGIFRNYGISVYLSINYSSPIELGGLSTADPLDKAVQDWWCKKAAEIYEYIPDLGGFLVKADSEFRPGPFTYGRTHDQGANMLAKALEPFGGIVIWRCFVYNCRQDWRDTKTDRANAAYDHFMPLDGKFMDNVVLQIKNGPMDFQVREPVSPLFGGLTKTNQILELQITQEYTGQQKHVCFLIPQWKEVLDFETWSNGPGSTVKKLVCGKVYPQKHCGFAAVSNIGDNANWTGHVLAQANLYGYGRLTWNPDLSSEAIAEEWIRLTFSNDPEIIGTISDILLKSWLTYEKYTSPLGIGWMVNPNHHYGPNVDGYEYSPWGTYHRADWRAIGVDRTVARGTGFAGRYHKPNADMYEDMDKCPEELLLFFHRVAYRHRLKSGKTLIQHIYDTHFEGVEEVEQFREKWLSLEGKIDRERFESVLERLDIQLKDAREWRDVVNSYFYRKSGIPDEKGRTIY